MAARDVKTKKSKKVPEMNFEGEEDQNGCELRFIFFLI